MKYLILQTEVILEY